MSIDTLAARRSGNRSVTANEIRQALRCDRPACACRRGRIVHCPHHADKTPSFAVDERNGCVVFRCHAGCTQDEVLEALRRRGLWRTRTRAAPTRRLPPLVEARLEVLAHARRQAWAREGVHEIYLAADVLKLCDRTRASVTVETERGWDLLGELAVITTDAEALAADAMDCV